MNLDHSFHSDSRDWLFSNFDLSF